MSKKFKITGALAGQRLDVALAKLSGQSRSFWQDRIKSGLVRMGGQEIKASYITEGGETLSIDEPMNQPVEMVPKAIPVIYKDEDIIVIDKPAGVVVHPTRPGEASVVAAFRDEVTDIDEERPGIVHRLDKDTSGVMVLARNPAAKKMLQEQFAGREVAKTYLVLVQGTPRAAEAVVKLPIGRSSSRPTSRTVKKEGKEATTRYKLIERFSGYSLIEAHPETGRTHQIRVHFRHIGHPVAGDVVYGDRRRPRGLGRQFLHATSLTFKMPSGVQKTFTSPIPPDLQAFLDQLKKQV
jgi:23S rRNA pseudouridine1911/1915/1917 synthase